MTVPCKQNKDLSIKSHAWCTGTQLLKPRSEVLGKRTIKSMQVNASLQNQNLRTDLRWVAKRIRKS